MGANQDKLARAYSRLRSLRANLPENARSLVEEYYVVDYHEVLQHLDDLGIDVSEFRVPDTLINPIPVAASVTHPWARTGKPSFTYSQERYVNRNILMSKIDAVLGYFELITEKPDEPQKRIGFRK